MIASGVIRGATPPIVSSSSVHPPERPIPDTHEPCFIGPSQPYHRFPCPGMSPGTPARRFRHSGWQHLRNLVYHALWDTDQTIARKNSFSECGHGAYVLRAIDNPHKYRLAGSTCHDRFCTPCATERSRTIATNVAARLGTDGCRFLTLTVRAEQYGLRDAIAHLYASFRRLQRKTHWGQRVTGGVAFLEIKWNEVPGRWHPHLHCLLSGKYIAHKWLSDTWRDITIDSFIVDIRPCKGAQAVTRYVTKYASKPLNTTYCNDHERLCEAVTALKGKRICITFGDWKGTLLVDHPDEDGWEQIDSLASIIARASSGEVEARAILHALDGKAAEHVLAVLLEERPRPPPPHPPQSHSTQSRFDWSPIVLRD